MTVEYMGNKALLEREMTAFLAPSHVSPLAVLPTLDWAAEMASEERTVVSGFSSRLEKEVFAVLTRGTSPIVLVTVRPRYTHMPSNFKAMLDSGRLLIISLGLGVRLNRKNSPKRNEYVANLASEIVFPSINKDSSLFPLYERAVSTGKPVRLLSE